ncbi:MAG: heat shock protein Hsp20, family protein [Parcubacteria group bacterium]|nr:heat shock protein Hsp20, family protein [Parcubacteria group bacterium]
MKSSFFDRLSGSSSNNDGFDSFDDELPAASISRKDNPLRMITPSSRTPITDDDSAAGGEGQLPVDVHQTQTDIVIRAFVAGVRPDELSISISRDMVEIGGARAEREQVAAADYFTRELFWGSFARKILLPQEIDVEASSASAKDGLLTIVLPRLDKAKQTKLRVKAG